MVDLMGANQETDNRKALTEFVMDSDDLVRLEGRLSRFNIFHVLRAAHNELRHSNMLAWLLDPEESHGLGDRFLRRWLMKVLHDATSTVTDLGSGGGKRLPSPIEIDVVDIEFVEVARERAGIDVLLIIETGAGSTWVVSIENKVDALQQEDQLLRYRRYVEDKFPKAERSFFVFLTKNGEEPNDDQWIPSTYSEVKDVLGSCLEEREKSIGPEPLLLIKQYLDLLAEDFVDETDSAALARKIYQKHKRAIDFILENRDDPISDGSEALQEMLKGNAADLGIVMAPCGKGLVRFLPKEWDLPQNSGGTAWGANSRLVVWELTFWPKNIELHLTIGKAPDAWVDRIWERAAQPPFRQETKQRARMWVKPYKARSEFGKVDLAEFDDDNWTEVFNWVRKELQKPAFKEAVEIVRQFLLELKTG